MSLKYREDSIKLIRRLIRISLILTNPEFSLSDEVEPEECCKKKEVKNEDTTMKFMMVEIIQQIVMD